MELAQSWQTVYHGSVYVLRERWSGRPRGAAAGGGGRAWRSPRSATASPRAQLPLGLPSPRARPFPPRRRARRAPWCCVCPPVWTVVGARVRRKAVYYNTVSHSRLTSVAGYCQCLKSIHRDIQIFTTPLQFNQASAFPAAAPRYEPFVTCYMHARPARRREPAGWARFQTLPRHTLLNISLHAAKHTTSELLCHRP